MITLEIACNSYTSCLHALRGGANRIELFENLADGGCTPSYGMIKKVKQEIALPVYVMIRPRGGNFCYTNDEIDIMLGDIEVCKQLKVDGIVFGILNEVGEVDTTACKKLLDAWNNGPATFHRAIDRSTDIFTAAQSIIDLGFERILTSGGRESVTAGIDTIQKLHERFGDAIEIMPGGGVMVQNARAIAEHCKVKSIHASCKTSISLGDEGQVSGLEEIMELRRILDK